MSTDKRYKVTNTTIKPKKISRAGEDLRPIRDRVGYGVSFMQEGNPVTIYAGRTAIVKDLNEGLLKLYRKGVVRIETIEDIAQELRIHSNPPEKVPAGKPLAEKPESKEETKSAVTEEETSNEPSEESPFEGRASAAPMGETHDGDKLVNPDGEPNFVAKAPKGGPKRNKKKSKKDEEAE